jgi:hypothetical protein
MTEELESANGVRSERNGLRKLDGRARLRSAYDRPGNHKAACSGTAAEQLMKRFATELTHGEPSSMIVL